LRSDLYSLGIIFYEMLTGRVPYTAETPIAVVFKHVQDPLPSARQFNPSLSEGLELVLLKSLAKNPEERYQTADAFVRAVQQVISENPSADKTLSEKITPLLLAQEAANVIDKEAVSETESRRQTPPRFPGWSLAGIGLLGLVIVAAAMMMSRANANRAETVTLQPTIAPTELPALVGSPITVSPTSDPPNTALPGNSFRDEFENQLGAGWTWLAEDRARWSLTQVPGWLQILASDASFDGPSFPTNLLLREPPEGDFEMTTLLQFAPTSNFQFGGLVVFQDKANVLQFGRAFCDLADSCVGDGIYFDNFEGGFIVANHKAAFRGSQIYLRLRRVGTTYTAYFSEDGDKWIMLGEHTRDLSPVRVGVMAAQAEEEIPAGFDYFAVTRLKE
jgi:hypothetical protein